MEREREREREREEGNDASKGEEEVGVDNVALCNRSKNSQASAKIMLKAIKYVIKPSPSPLSFRSDDNFKKLKTLYFFNFSNKSNDF